MQRSPHHACFETRWHCLASCGSHSHDSSRHRCPAVRERRSACGFHRGKGKSNQSSSSNQAATPPKKEPLMKFGVNTATTNCAPHAAIVQSMRKQQPAFRRIATMAMMLPSPFAPVNSLMWMPKNPSGPQLLVTRRQNGTQFSLVWMLNSALHPNECPCQTRTTSPLQPTQGLRSQCE